MTRNSKRLDALDVGTKLCNFAKIDISVLAVGAHKAKIDDYRAVPTHLQ